MTRNIIKTISSVYVNMPLKSKEICSRSVEVDTNYAFAVPTICYSEVYYCNWEANEPSHVFLWLQLRSQCSLFSFPFTVQIEIMLY